MPHIAAYYTSNSSKLQLMKEHATSYIAAYKIDVLHLNAFAESGTGLQLRDLAPINACTADNFSNGAIAA